MKLNRFLWNNFLESNNGRDWLDFFNQLRLRYEKNDEKLASFIEEWLSHGTLDQVDVKISIEGVLDALRELEGAMNDGLIPSIVSSFEDAAKFYEEIGDLVEDDDEDDHLFYADDIPGLSVALHMLFPKFFFPYYFYPNFFELKKICDEFGIFLPPVPAKSGHYTRFFYYLEVCESMYEFWIGLGLDPIQIPVFLYGFCPQVVDFRHPAISELPKPHRAWFIGGGINNNGDNDYLDGLNDNSETFWQGNKETEVGDIVVMYCLAPRCYIHSIWRAIRPGGVDPFWHYYNSIWIGYPQKVNTISLSEIKSDPVLSELPLVKGNMQGINGRNIPKKFYDRILELLMQKGMDTSSLPQLEDIETRDLDMKNEKDVEAHLLEPLLRELGFSESDWERQVKLRVGSGERVYPDYLINISKDATVRAEWVWEAKYSIASHAQLKKDFGQVCSYGKLVEAKGVALISKEGVWIGKKEDGFSLEKVQYWTASQIHQVDHLNEIRKIAGKKRN